MVTEFYVLKMSDSIYNSHMAKPPGIPFALIEKFRGEAPTVTQGFLNVVIFWIDQGKLEPIEEARIERLSLLPRNIWLLSGKLIVERLNEFWEPMILAWKIKQHKSELYGKIGLLGRQSRKQQKELRKQALSTIPKVSKNLLDDVQEFSRQPVKIERKKTGILPPAFIISTQKSAPLKGTLKDK